MFSIADIEMEDEPVKPTAIMGKILLFTNNQQKTPDMSMRHPIGTNLGHVLHSLGDLYSPIKRKHSTNSIPLLLINSFSSFQDVESSSEREVSGM